MTEEEAKAKWCPYSRVWSQSSGTECSGGYNRHPESSEGSYGAPSGTRCIGSACMAWRKLPATVRNLTEKHVKQTSRDGEVPVQHVIYDHKVGEDVTPNGFCGLAGKP